MSSWLVMPVEFTLRSRLLARHVECLRIRGGSRAALNAVAHALSRSTPIPSTPRVQVELVPLLAASGQGLAAVGVEDRFQRQHHQLRDSPGRAARLGGTARNGDGCDGRDPSGAKTTDRRYTGERRVHLIADQRATLTQLSSTLSQSARRPWNLRSTPQ